MATLALGITTVTPRYIEKVLCDDKLNREKIGSHLQKFRIAIAKFNHIDI